VQYHPESIKTDGGGLQVLQNFWRLAHQWLETHNGQPSSWTKESDQVFGTPWPALQPRPTQSITPGSHTMTTRSLSASSLSVPALCELMGVADDVSPFVLLDSASAPGRHSIIGCLTNSSIRITYNVGDSHVGISQEDNKCHYEDLEGVDVYSWIATFMRSRRFKGGDPSVPFWGGLVGCLSYELGVVGLGVPLALQSREDDTTRHPDVNLVYVERSLVYDMTSGTVHVQSLITDDPWVSAIAARISEAASHHQQQITTPKGHPGTFRFPRVVYPDKELYLARIREAQQHLSAGDSYELCLTARTRITVPPSSSQRPRTSSSWDLYKTARRRNPAPHAAYLRLHPTTLISSSPERFLSFSRPPNTVCQLRPIKGTLRKSPHVGRAAAERALVGSKKEVAENLMIVDLIRHDLHGVVGEDVHVTKFCGVEEYETVWQMVSVIEGSVSEEARRRDPGIEHGLGWEVLRRSLPPGSCYAPL
jgi:para-aminobenzoate synthetase